MNGFWNFIKGIRIKPVTSSAVAQKGDLEVTNATGKLNYHNGTTASPIVTETSTATLTNKTLKSGLIVDSGNQTVVDINAHQLWDNSGATMLDFSDFVGSGMNFQGNQLKNIASPSAPTDAVDLLTLNAHINNVSGAHAASAISNTPSGNLAATNAQGALNELQSDIDTRATSAALTTHAATTATHGVTGALVGTTDTQALTNKDHDGGTASNTSRFTLPKNTSANLTALTRKQGTILFDTTQLKPVFDDGSNLVAIGSGGSGGGVNFLALDTTFLPNKSTNSDFETTVGDWVAYADAAGTSPVDMTGGAPNVTITRSTSSPLDGAAHGLLTKDAVNRQGQGISCNAYIPIAYRTSRIYYEIPYKITSGTFALDDAQVFAYDVTNSQVITPFRQSKLFGTQGVAFGYFDIQSTTAQIRFGIHVVSTSASAYTIAFDDVKVTPVARSFSVPMSDWQSYTPAPVGFGTPSNVNFRYRRVGDTIEINGKFTAGTNTATEARIPLPPGLTTKDTNTIPSIQSCGILVEDQVGVSAGYMLIEPSVTYMTMSFQTASNQALAKINGNNINNGAVISVTGVNIPISGWSSNVQMADSATWLASSYLANGTRVTTTPTSLGQYRTFKKIINDSSGTDDAPSVGPSLVDGMRIYAVAYNAAGSVGQPGRWEIFVGKGRDPGTVKLRAYGTTGRSGFIDVTPQDNSTTSAVGLMFAYDQSTGIAVVDAMWANNGTNTAHFAGTGITAGGGNTPTASNCYFDVVVSENALSVGVDRRTPTIQTLTSGSGTYVTPLGATYLKVRMVGGGGGGGGSGTAGAIAGGNGGNTTFGGTLLVANGAAGASSGGPGGTGGTASIGAGAIGTTFVGGTGTGNINGNAVSGIYLAGSPGAFSPFGGAGGGGNGLSPGLAGAANTGSGGGGGGSNSTAAYQTGPGGGAGGYVDAMIISPAATYAYAVGAAGSAAAAGTSGWAGGAGGSGVIIVEEYYT